MQNEVAGVCNREEAEKNDWASWMEGHKLLSQNQFVDAFYCAFVDAFYYASLKVF